MNTDTKNKIETANDCRKEDIMRFLRSLPIINASTEHRGGIPVIYRDFAAVGLTLPEITDEMIENADLFEDGHVRFCFLDVPDNIKAALIKQVESSDNYNLADDKIERYVFDLEAATDGKHVIYATMGVSVVMSPDGDSSNEYAGEYDTLPVVFDSQEEHDAVLRALLLVNIKNN